MMTDYNKYQYSCFFKEFDNPLIVSERVRLDDYFKSCSKFDKR